MFKLSSASATQEDYKYQIKPARFFYLDLPTLAPDPKNIKKGTAPTVTLDFKVGATNPDPLL
jgi:hypothetical protein